MPTDSVKVLIVERNGSELDGYEEFNLTASVVPFSAPGFTSDNVKDAIIEGGGTDYLSAQNELENGDIVTIPRKKQMYAFNYISNADGEIVNSGEVIIGG